jgi:hypothetical protein
LAEGQRANPDRAPISFQNAKSAPRAEAQGALFYSHMELEEEAAYVEEAACDSP